MLVTQSVHALRLPFRIPVAPGIFLERFVNVFLICGRTITLIDTGVAGCEKVISGYIAATGRDPSEISLIVQTHSHPDHIGATHAIQKETGCEVAIYPDEKEWIEDTDKQRKERPVPGFDSLVGGPVQAGRVLEDGDVIALGGEHHLDLVVHHTPGHSPGSVSLFLESEGVLFSGDAVPVPGELPVYDDVLASVRSIRRLEKIDGVRVLLSAWDEPQAGVLAYQRMNEGLLYLQRIHESVLAAADDQRADLMELCKEVAEDLRLPQQAVTPLLARTLSANLRLRDRKNILAD
jgi:glyoxylase-like metal-dependent hydrolase (beta-lactamase superfamily II)